MKNVQWPRLDSPYSYERYQTHECQVLYMHCLRWLISVRECGIVSKEDLEGVLSCPLARTGEILPQGTRVSGPYEL